MKLRNTAITVDQVKRLQDKLGQGTIITFKKDVVLDLFTLRDKVVLVTGKGAYHLDLVCP